MSTRTKNKKEALAKVEGSWLSHIDVDGKRYHSAHLTNLIAGLIIIVASFLPVPVTDHFGPTHHCPTHPPQVLGS